MTDHEATESETGMSSTKYIATVICGFE